MEKINGTEYLRVSEINSYLECPARFYFDSIEKIEVPNKIALAGGTAYHKALETNYVQKIESRTDLPVSDVIDAFSSSYDDEIEIVDKADFEIEKPGTVKDNWIEVLKIYMKDTAYRIFPVDVERRISAKLKNWKYGLTGKVDIKDEDAVIVDHKTTSKPYKSTPENYKLQCGGGYPLLDKILSLSDESHKQAKAARIDYNIRKSPKSPKAEVRNIAVDIDIPYFLNVFDQVQNGISAGVFPPNRQHIYCTKRFCKFWNECELKFKGKVRE